MKTCSNCGRENEDHVTACQWCGGEFIVGQASKEHASADPTPDERFERISVLDNEAQAGLLDAILLDRGVPHIMQTYHDSAYDGLFQAQKGWGVILAPAAFRDEIQAALAEIKGQSETST